LQKLKKLWTLIEVPGYNVRYTLCLWADAVKNMFSTLSKLPKRVWKKDGDLPLDYTSAYSEMPGAPNYINDKHKTAMKAPTKNLDDELRRKGLI